MRYAAVLVAPPVLLFALILAKASYLTATVHPSSKFVFWLAADRADFVPLVFLLLLLGLEGTCAREAKRARTLTVFFSLAACIVYVLDTAVRVVFHQRLLFWDVMRWAGQPIAWTPY